jgi:hypothetical protein
VIDMREIANKQQRRGGNTKGLFYVIWTEKMDCFVEIWARTKKEALELFYKAGGEFCNGVQCCQSETVRRPNTWEVK